MTALVVGVSLAALGCGPKNEFVEPPPLAVDVLRPLDRPVTVFVEFPGRTQAKSQVEIRARVTGIIQEKHFTPGSFVKTGDLLFTIEPDEYEARLAAARASEAEAAAALELAGATRKATEQALASRAVAQIEFEKAKAQEAVAQATLESAQASVQQAQLDIDYTQVRSPADGRVSREFVDVGNLVSAAEATILTTVVNDDPVYVNFEISERAILPYLRRRPDTTDVDPTALRGEPVLRLILSDGAPYPLKGRFDFIDNVVDPESGTLRVRAEFENPDGALAGGLFVRVGIPQNLPNEQFPKAVLVPRSAVQRDLQGDFVLVVGDDAVVERRLVEPSPFSVGDYRVLAGGVTASDRVVVSNLQRARDGLAVAPTEIAPEPLTAPESAANPDGPGPPEDGTADEPSDP